uniref:Serpin domain-containing protein n=1 Tax=Romanomermis culicivorax TaxID=13658 RepID=A0A915KYC9_ROMCU
MPAGFSTPIPNNSNNAKFTSQLSQLLANENLHGNFLFSPVSLEILFFMVQHGAPENTSTNQQIWTNIFNCENCNRNLVDRYFDSLFQAPQLYMTEDATLKYATVLAMNERFPVSDQFEAKMLGGLANATLFQENFAKNGDQAAHEINNIVAQTTENKINNLISGESLDDKTAMVLVNALYLKADFKECFTYIYDDKFYDSNNQEYYTKFLDGSFEDLSYHKSVDLSMIKLPFLEENFSLYIAMRNENGASIDLGDVVRQTLAKEIAFKDKYVNVKIPKFTMEYTAEDMVQHIQMLNVTNMFNESIAEFNYLLKDLEQKVAVSDIRHKAFIETSSPHEPNTSST